MDPSSLRSACVYFDLSYDPEGLPNIKLLKFIESIPTSGSEDEKAKYHFVDCGKDLRGITIDRIRDLGLASNEWDPNHEKDMLLSEAELVNLIDITTLFKKLGIKRGSNS
tara:strand:- start:387 stop:716 length:330 start_codon:yes stop_codon:yes gene_type:complete